MIEDNRRKKGESYYNKIIHKMHQSNKKQIKHQMKTKLNSNRRISKRME